MNTGEKIKELRELYGMTQEELAEKLGLKKAAVNKYETGRVVNLKRSTIEKLCEIFNITPQELMGMDEDPNITSDRISDNISTQKCNLSNEEIVLLNENNSNKD